VPGTVASFKASVLFVLCDNYGNSLIIAETFQSCCKYPDKHYDHDDQDDEENDNRPEKDAFSIKGPLTLVDLCCRRGCIEDGKKNDNNPQKVVDLGCYDGAREQCNPLERLPVVELAEPAAKKRKNTRRQWAPNDGTGYTGRDRRRGLIHRWRWLVFPGRLLSHCVVKGCTAGITEL